MKIGVLGATGFTGEKLVELLSGHSKVELAYLSSRTPRPVAYSEMFPRFQGLVDMPCEHMDVKKAARKCETLFLSLPHTVSMEVAAYLLKQGKKVVDLSADYRIKDPAVYKKYYNTAHKDKNNLKQAVYGLTEFFKEKIKTASLIANPGCYPTGIELALLPLLREKVIDSEIMVSSVSSITGAGRKAKIEYHYDNIADNIWAYKPFVHQHVPEIVYVLETLGKRKVDLTFIPHVAGVAAGIHSTIVVKPAKKMNEKKLFSLYTGYYKKAPFVRIKKCLPSLKEVVNTNFCDIGFSFSPKGKKLVITSCIDNLIKGAAGSAVQNMNVMCGFNETEGLL